MSGRIYLIPNLLGVVAPTDVLPGRTLAVARQLRHFVVENAKPARAFLKSLGTVHAIQELQLAELGEHPTAADCDELLRPAREGHDLGLVSDAGCPAVADPGAALVAAAHRRGLSVTPLVGPSAILLALMASGMNGQGFTFHGYLPAKSDQRVEAIRRIEGESRRQNSAQLFIETPYRNQALIEALAATCRPETRLCVAADLTTPTESIECHAIRNWRTRNAAAYTRRPAMFVLQA